MKKITLAIAMAMLSGLLASCGKQSKPAASSEQVSTTHEIQIVPAPKRTYPAATLKIIAPREGEVLKNSRDSVRIVMLATGMNLGVPTDSDTALGIAYAKQGQNIHVIVDSNPYRSDFQNGQPFNVGILSPGMHVIRAFPSFSWQEGVKSPAAFATRTFYVGSAPAANIAPANNLNNLDGPLLIYSSPKGTYPTNESAKVLLDFYISNAKLGPDGYRVKLWIDSVAMPDIVVWQPYYIEGLSKGKHTITLQLVSPNGRVVPGSFNSPSQEITIE